MIKIFKFLKESWVWIITIFALLVVQAYCDLELPAYTSDLIDVGIQQSGVDSVLPIELSVNSYNKLKLFMSEDENNKIIVNYTFNSERYILNDIEDDLKSELEEIITTPILMVYTLENIDPQMMADSDSRFSEIPQGMTVLDAMSYMPAEDRLAAREEMLTKLDSYGDSMVESMAIQFITNEYTYLNIDLDAMQLSYLKTVGLKMIGLSALMMAVSIFVGFLASRVGSKFGLRVRESLFKKVVSFTNAEMDKFSTASLITRNTNDIQQVQNIIIMLLRMIMYAPILGIGGVIKVINTDTGLSWIIVVSVAAILALVLILMVVAMPKFKKMQTLVDRLNLVTREILTGLPVIRAFSREKHEEKRFDEASTNLMKTQLFTNRTMTFMMPAMMLIMNAVTLLIMWFGGKGIDAGNLQVGDMMAFISYTMQIVMSFLMLTMISIMLPRASVAAGRIMEVLETEVSVEDKDDVHANGQITKGDIHFDNVSFKYGDAAENVLENINFTAKAGKTTAIIGSTGSGKSTLINLIPRFFDVTAGKITIDGNDLRDLPQQYIRENIGLVPQKGVLFSGTIASNLRFGNVNATDDEISFAAEIAQAEDFISEKPEKYESPISQGGTNVSGGQKQRLAIARAIVKKPKIYIFDDSFSALDYKTDSKLRKALNQNVGDSTVIIVAQRISTILHAEQIIVLDDGKVAGIGTHDELMKNCEVYEQIARSQLSESELSQNSKEAM